MDCDQRHLSFEKRIPHSVESLQPGERSLDQELLALPIGLRLLRRVPFPHKLGLLDRLYGASLSRAGVAWVILQTAQSGSLICAAGPIVGLSTEIMGAPHFFAGRANG